MNTIVTESDRDTKGIVFNIQRFAVHDGPGIRTVVFLKGCNLRCLWCCNPESQSSDPELAINWNLCTTCKKCLDYCPHGANKIVNGEIFYLKENCKLCGLCLHLCPGQSRKLYGRLVGLNEVVEEIKKDKPFYDNSGGGITVSGGEPFLQPKFLLSLLRRSRRELLHMAIETSGYFRWQMIDDEILDHVDLMLFDLKLMDEKKHKQFTGQGNQIILRNLAKMVDRVKTIIRVPVIAGINDDVENINPMIKFILDLKRAEEVNLIPYHNFGEFKYAMLEREYEKEAFSSPAPEKLSKIRDLFESKGIRATIED